MIEIVWPKWMLLWLLYLIWSVIYAHVYFLSMKEAMILSDYMALSEYECVCSIQQQQCNYCVNQSMCRSHYQIWDQINVGHAFLWLGQVSQMVYLYYVFLANLCTSQCPRNLWKKYLIIIYTAKNHLKKMSKKIIPTKILELCLAK